MPPLQGDTAHSFWQLLGRGSCTLLRWQDAILPRAAKWPVIIDSFEVQIELWYGPTIAVCAFAETTAW